MHTLTRPVFIIALMIALAVASGAGDRQQQPTGSISGRVTIGGKGSPGVLMTLRPTRYTGRRDSLLKIKTDEDGRFRFDGLAAGEYNVMPFTRTLVNPRVGLIGDAGKAVSIDDGEAVEGIDFALARGGVITGRVTDADGRPLIARYVKLTIFDERGQKRSDVGYQSPVFETDDRGVYRVYGLPAGRYLVSMGVEKNDTDIDYNTESGYYARTYHPNVTDESKAGVVELAEGGEATGIDITLGRALPTYSASGRIVDAVSGKPVANVVYGRGVVSPQVRELSSIVYGERSNSRGEFRIEGLTPGRFAVITDPEGRADLYGDPVAFEITDKDVTGLEVKLHRGATLSGVVTIEGTSDENLASRLSRLRLGISIDSPKALDSPRSIISNVAADGHFRFTGLRPGKASLFFAGPVQKGLSLLTIERDGIEQSEGLTIARGEQITGVRVRLAAGKGIVRGQVKVNGGVLPENVRLYVLTRTTGASMRDVKFAEVDTRGRFIIEDLMDGDYELELGISYLSDSAPLVRPDTMPLKQNVRVTSAAEAEVTFNLDLNPGSRPQ
ncbi:MAG: carboxypeptidase-like regulatory domain-containing protein [Pyrinomonadaceae bacterium]